MPDLSIIVPTYCEAENLPFLIPRVHEVLVAADIDAEILILDDNSPDNTSEVCAELAELYPARLIVRTENRGLSPAVIDGMKAASGRVVLVMDADLSHPPEKIPDLYHALDDPAVDFVIGSRYVPGGTTAEDWGLFRWINSKIATLFARPFTKAKDPMAGFIALRRAAFDAAADQLDPIGYKIGLELIVKCGCRNVVEVPIDFSDRLKGESKLTLKEQVNYLRHVKRLFDYRFGGLTRFALFCLVGSSGFLVDMSSFLLLELIISLRLAGALAIWIAMTWNFLLNRRFTFADARRHHWFQQYVKYCLSCLAGAFVNWQVRVLLCERTAFFADYIALAAFVGVLAGTVFNFVLCHTLVFRPGRPKAFICPATEDVESTATEQSEPEEVSASSK